MKRSMMQVYVQGSLDAVALYQKAFDAALLEEVKNADGSGYYHSELDVYGQVLAVAEQTEAVGVTGNTMQFCLHFAPEEAALVDKAYDALRQDAEILTPLGPCDFSPLMTDLIDKYGVRWCLFAV